MAPSKVVMLIANETNPTNLQNADKLRTLFKSKKIVWEEIDGTDPNNKEKRSELFGISGLRAEYPQVFFQDSASSQYRFIGNYGKVSTLNENAQMVLSHPEILEHSPDVADQVFDKVFAEVMPGVEAKKDAQSEPVAERQLNHQSSWLADMVDAASESPKRQTTEAKTEEKTTSTEVKATVEETDAKAEATVEEANKKAEQPVLQPAESTIFAMSFEQQQFSRQTTVEQSHVDQKESPMTMSPTSVHTNIVDEQKEEKAEKEEKEANGEQILECNEVVLLEKDAAENTDEKTEEAQEDEEEEQKPSDKVQPLRKRDRVKRWFKRVTGSQRT